jgi:hypothetical protein
MWLLLLAVWTWWLCGPLRQHGTNAKLEQPREVDGGRKITEGAELDIDPNMIRETSHVQFGVLGAVKVSSMVEDCSARGGGGGGGFL